MATTRKTAAPKRKPAAKRPARTKAVIAPAAPELVPTPSAEEREALLSAYTALKSAGLGVPAEIAQQVDGWIEEERQRREAEAALRAEQQVALDEENAKGPWYVRNGYRAPFSLRLERQTEKRRIELKPRGAPGDMHPLEEGDLNDPTLRRNLGLGVIEVIPAGEANRVMDHQTTNMGPRVHTPTALLRNAQGHPYEEGAIKVEAEFNEQGVVVGRSDPKQMQGLVPDKEVGGTRSFGGIQRVAPGERQVVSEFIPTGGNPAIIHNGPLPVGGLGDNAQAKISDDLARRRDVQGPAAGLGGLQVTVAPPVKE